MNNTKSELRQFIKKELRIDKKISFSENIFANGILDSLNVIKMLVFIENKYSVKIPFNELLSGKFNSINNIASMILKK